MEEVTAKKASSLTHDKFPFENVGVRVETSSSKSETNVDQNHIAMLMGFLHKWIRLRLQDKKKKKMAKVEKKGGRKKAGRMKT